MKMLSRRGTFMKQKFIVIFFLLAFIAASATRPLVAAESRISIGVTETMETFNPYGDSVALMYSVWCQVLGCLGTYDFDKGQHVGLLVENWEVKDPKTWLFHLRKNNRFHVRATAESGDEHVVERSIAIPCPVGHKQQQGFNHQVHSAMHDLSSTLLSSRCA